MSALNQMTGSTRLPNTGGSISTIAGNALAPRLLWHLQQNIRSRGAYYKLSLLFGGHDPIVSLTALLGIDSNAYTGLPQRGSAMAFELYSMENSTTSPYPSLDNLRVAFKFRNGTATDAPFSGPSQVDMSWDDFENIMTYLSIGGTGDWCQQCGSDELFCAAWNMNAVDSSGGATGTGHAALSPIAAGAVGAVVALAVAALIFIVVMLLGRFRFHRQPKHGKSALGGFKGSAKLASDPDLVVANNGVNVAAISRADGHERTGSWEMRAKEQDAASRISLEDGNPFADPVRPHEHV